MQEVANLSRYPLAIRILHWLMAIMIIGLLAVGLIMTGLAKNNPLRGTLFSLHKSFGLTVLLLFFLRVSLRFRLGVPPLPAAIPFFERKLAELGHWAFYGFMVLMPVSGYLMSASYGLPVKWFGLQLPKLVGIDKTRGMLADDVHDYAAYALMALVALHVSAVILHYATRRINLLKRML